MIDMTLEMAETAVRAAQVKARVEGAHDHHGGR
jgi:hypothetical protein